MTIRLRLALWYTAFLATMFAVLAPAVYFALERETLGEVDRWLAPVSDRVVRSASDNARAIDALKGTPPGDLTGSQIIALLSAYKDLDLERFTSNGVYVEILDAEGHPIVRSPNLGSQSLPLPDQALAASRSEGAGSFTADWNSARFRGYLATIPGDREPRGFVLAARSLAEIDRALARIRIWLVAGILAGLGLAIGLGWLLARNALMPIEEITSTARAIALSRSFERRLRVRQVGDEIGRLASTLNDMLTSLDEAYAAQRRFVADASHELRTPLTSIRSNIDILKRAVDAPREDREEMLADAAAEIDRISRLVADLLLLARADAGNRFEKSRISLDDLLRDVIRQMASQAGEVTIEPGDIEPVAVEANVVWLKQLFLILIDNALKYTPSGGVVRLSLVRDDARAIVRVSDNGIGIAAEDLPHIFDRFYRADKARARDEGGAGLGLSIARWIAQQHDAVLEAESAQGSGTTFILSIAAVE